MEWLTGIATIIAALLSTWSISRTNRQNRELTEQQNQWNEQAATTAYGRGIEQWNRETDYGSQMSRLESAGINPALAYSSGVSMPSFSAVTPAHGVTPAKMQAMDFSGLASGAQSIAQYNLQKDLNEAQIKDLNASAASKMADVPLKEQQVLNLQQDIKESSQRIAESVSKINLMDAQAKTEAVKQVKTNWDMLNGDRRFQLDAEHIGAVIRNLDSDTDLKKSQRRLTEAERVKCRREVFEMIQTFADRCAGIKLGNELTATEIAQSMRAFDHLGFSFSVENGNVVLHYLPGNTAAKMQDNSVYIYGEMLCRMLGQIFSVSIK